MFPHLYPLEDTVTTRLGPLAFSLSKSNTVNRKWPRWLALKIIPNPSSVFPLAIRPEDKNIRYSSNTRKYNQILSSNVRWPWSALPLGVAMASVWQCSCSVGVELACTESGSGKGGNIWVAVANSGRVGSIGIVTNWSLHKCIMSLLKMAALLSVADRGLFRLHRHCH